MRWIGGFGGRQPERMVKEPRHPAAAHTPGIGAAPARAGPIPSPGLADQSAGGGQYPVQVVAGVAGRIGGNLLGSADRHHPSSLAPPFRTEVDQVVSRFHDIQVVLYHNHRVAPVDQAVQNPQKAADILEVQPGGGLVQNVHGPSSGPLAQLRGQT